MNLTATFKTLPSGLTHVNYAEVVVPAKNLSVQVQNMDYHRSMPPPSTQMAGSKNPAAGGTPSLETAERKLKDLKVLFEKGLITQSEYDAKKAQILEGL